MKFLSYTGLLSFVNAAITDGTVEYLTRSIIVPAPDGVDWGKAFAELTFTAGVLTGTTNGEFKTGPIPTVANGMSLSGNQAIVEGTYDATGAALTNPDVAKWTQAEATDNAFWAQGSAQLMTYYSATIDSATDRFSGKYQLITTYPAVVMVNSVGKFEVILTSVGGFTQEEIDAAAVAANPGAIAAWKLAVKAANVIPCANNALSAPCTKVTPIGGTEVDAQCGTATLPAASSGVYTDRDFSVLGCFPLADCFKADNVIPGTAAPSAGWPANSIDVPQYNFDCGAQKLLAGLAAAAAVAFSL